MATLYRPVGLNELALIWDSGCRSFPSRLPEQPIFYPVTSVEYATQIARNWNTKASGLAGFVTSFEVDDQFLTQFDRHIVGSAVHEEYWIPAERLPDFNRSVRGQIDVEAAFFGELFAGFVPEGFNLKGKTAEAQFVILARSWDYSRMDFTLEVSLNRKAVYLNCLFWVDHDFTPLGITPELKSEALAALPKAWEYNQIEPGLPSVFCASII